MNNGTTNHGGSRESSHGRTERAPVTGTVALRAMVRRVVKPLLLGMGLVVVLAGCDDWLDDDGITSSRRGTAAVRMVVDTTNLPSEITVTGMHLALEEFEFEREFRADDREFTVTRRTTLDAAIETTADGPSLGDGTGDDATHTANLIEALSVAVGTYDQIELDLNEDEPGAITVTGTYTASGGTAQPFTIRATRDQDVRAFHPDRTAFQVTEDQTTPVTVRFDASRWFAGVSPDDFASSETAGVERRVVDALMQSATLSY